MANWSTVSTPNTGSAVINDLICVGAGKFVAVGTGGTVLTSGDSGQTWVSRSAAEANDWNGLAFDGTTVVAVASTGVHRVMVSTDDGHTWVAKSAAEANSWTSLTYAAYLGMFIAVAIDGVHRVMTSIDSGATWTARTAASLRSWSGVAASDALVLAIEGASGVVMKSTDGISWSASTSNPSGFLQAFSQGSNALVYSALRGGFAAPGWSGTAAKVAYTVDTSSWTYSAGAPLSSYFAFIAFAAADGYGGFLGSLPFNTAFAPTPTIIATSSDAGATWTAEDTLQSGLWQVAAWDDTNHVFVAWDGNATNTMLLGTFSQVSAVSPSTGPARGGTLVTISGSGLSGLSQGDVLIGGSAALSVSVAADGNSLTCITPAHAVGAVDVVLTGIGTLTAAYTYVSVTSVTPNSGTAAGGQAVTITGSGFNAATGVTFGGTAATDVVIVSNTRITATTPAHSSGAVDVAVLGVDTGSNFYTYTLGQAFLAPLNPDAPLLEGSPQKMASYWMRTLGSWKQRIEAPVTIVPEQIVGGAALTVVNDTNVLGRLTGTPESALLQPVTLAFDWQGTLEVTRGGTGIGAVSAGALLYGAAAQRWAALSIGAANTFLKSTGSAPAWTAGAALTRTNDTNVTLTLGGSASTALVNAASLTLGWTGTLATGRGGTGLDTSGSTGVAQVAAGTWSVTTTLQTAVQDNITRTGALNSGSITSGFGSIDVGADSITGGAFSGTTGTFSSTVKSGTDSVAGALQVNGAAGQARDLSFMTASVRRWTLRADATAETGSNAGSDFALRALNDAGTAIGTALAVTRSTMAATFGGALTVTGATTLSSTLGVTGASTLAALSATTGSFSSTLHVGGDFDVATSKFTVASATGNTAIAGTLGVTGAVTGASYSGGTVTGTVLNATTGFRANGVAASGTFLRGDGTNYVASTLTLPNAATATRVPYATGANAWGESANLTFDNSTSTLALGGGNLSLSWDATAGGTIQTSGGKNLNLNTGGNFIKTGAFQVVNGNTPSTGVGLEFAYISASNRSRLLSFDRDASAYKELDLQGSVLKVMIAATTALTVSAAGNLLVGAATDPGTGSSTLVFDDGTAPSSMASNTAGLYGNDVGGTVHPFAISEAGITMQLTGASNNTLATNVQDNITRLGKIATYNGVTAAGWGVPAIVASGRSTAQTAAVASIATYTVGASDASFEVNSNVLVTTATTYDFNVRIDYTDESNAAVTFLLGAFAPDGNGYGSIVNTVAERVFSMLPVRIRCKNGTSITVKTVGTFTSVTYNVEASIKQIS